MNKALRGGLSNGYALIVFAAFAISLSVVLASVAFAHGANTTTVLILRFAGLLLVIPWLARSRGITLKVSFRPLLAAMLIGAIFLAQTGGYLASVVYIPVSLAVLLFYTYPILTALLGAALDKRWPDRFAWIALVLAFAGIAIALEVSVSSFDWRGIAFVGIAACAAAIVLNSTQRVLNVLAPLQASFYTSAGAALVCLGLWAGGSELAWPDSTVGWQMLAASVASFIVFYPAMIAGIERIGAVPSAILFNLEPPFTIILAAALLGQSLTGIQLGGAALVVTAVLVGQIPAWRARQ